MNQGLFDYLSPRPVRLFLSVALVHSRGTLAPLGFCFSFKALKRDTGNTEDILCNWIQLEAVNVSLVFAWTWGTTSAKTVPYLITFYTGFSIDPLISGGIPLAILQVDGATSVELRLREYY